MWVSKHWLCSYQRLVKFGEKLAQKLREERSEALSCRLIVLALLVAYFVGFPFLLFGQLFAPLCALNCRYL